MLRNYSFCDKITNKLFYNIFLLRLWLNLNLNFVEILFILLLFIVVTKKSQKKIEGFCICLNYLISLTFCHNESYFVSLWVNQGEFCLKRNKNIKKLKLLVSEKLLWSFISKNLLQCYIFLSICCKNMWSMRKSRRILYLLFPLGFKV